MNDLVGKLRQTREPPYELEDWGNMKAEDESRLHDLIRTCLDHLLLPESGPLQDQAQAIRGFRATGPRIWQIDLDDSPAVSLPDQPLPIEASYADESSEVVGGVLIWTKNGRIDSLELPWFTDSMPRNIPSAQQLLFDE
ncbi:hypothetical protein [Curtobacterium flaccumfaciens]|uniref:hypothetical protein n=1 Tax=Curtobacterium flaccumfaciens TaxID=2035 RepID=UPI003CFAC0AA